MIHKDKAFATVTMPNCFFEVVTRCVDNTDEISLRKFIIESENTSLVIGRLTEDKFQELFKELVFNFGNLPTGRQAG
jgi:hypothetical protein